MKKALFIGLGTTGAEVLHKIRERIRMDVGDLRRVPFVKYLVAETDVSNPLHFAENEFVRIGIDQKGINMIHARQLDDQLDNPQEWLFDLNIQNVELLNGAQGARYQGRLCFFYPPNLQNLYNRMNQELNQLGTLTEPNARNAWGPNALWRLDDGIINIYIVGTGGGGTHSGAMIDLGFLLRFIVTEFPPCRTTRLMSFTCLPGVLPGNDMQDRKILGNSYGLLNDLLHFTERGNDYAWNYSFPGGQNARNTFWATNIAAQQLPFDFNYLVCAHQEGADIPFDDLKNILAMYLYTDVFHDVDLADFDRAARQGAHDAATLRDARRVDMSINFSRTEPLLGQQTCFLTFGISQIEFGRDRVISACGAKLLELALNKWRGNEFAGVRRGELDEVADIGQIEAKLLSSTMGEVGPGLLEILGIAPKQLFDESTGRFGQASGAMVEHEPGFVSYVNGALSEDTGLANALKEARAVISRGFGYEGMMANIPRGLFLNAIKENGKKAIANFKDRLKNWTVEALFDPNRGPDHVITGLTLLSRYAAYMSQAPVAPEVNRDEARDLDGIVRTHEDNISLYQKSMALGFVLGKGYAVSREKRRGEGYILEMFRQRLAQTVKLEITNVFKTIRPYVERHPDAVDRAAWDLLRRMKVFKAYTLDEAGRVVGERITELSQGNPITVVEDLFKFAEVTNEANVNSEFVRALRALGGGDLAGGAARDIVNRAIAQLFDDLRTQAGVGNPAFDPQASIVEFCMTHNSSLFDGETARDGRYFGISFTSVDTNHLFNTAERLFRAQNFTESLSAMRKFFEVHSNPKDRENHIDKFIDTSRYLLPFSNAQYNQMIHEKILIGPGFNNPNSLDQQKAKEFGDRATKHQHGPANQHMHHSPVGSTITYLREMGAWPLHVFFHMLQHYYHFGVLPLENNGLLYHVARADIEVAPPIPPDSGQRTREEVEAMVLFAIRFGIIRRTVPPRADSVFNFRGVDFKSFLSTIANKFLRARLRIDNGLDTGGNIYSELHRELETFINRANTDAYYRISDDGFAALTQNGWPDEVKAEKVKILKELNVTGDDNMKEKLFNGLRNTFVSKSAALQEARRLVNQSKADWFFREYSVPAPDGGVGVFKCKRCGKFYGENVPQDLDNLRDAIVNEQLLNCTDCKHYFFTGFRPS